MRHGKRVFSTSSALEITRHTLWRFLGILWRYPGEYAGGSRIYTHEVPGYLSWRYPGIYTSTIVTTGLGTRVSRSISPTKHASGTIACHRGAWEWPRCLSGISIIPINVSACCATSFSTETPSSNERAFYYMVRSGRLNDAAVAAPAT